MLTWSIIVFLILVNALYVLAEFSTVSVRRSRIRQLARDGNRLAQRLVPIIEDPRRLDRYVATCQIGITLSSLVLGAYGQATLATSLTPRLAAWGGWNEVVAQTTAAIAVLAGLTGLQVVIGELVPKSVALQFPVQSSLFSYAPMRWSEAAFSWFIAILNGSGIALLRLVGVREASHRHIHSPEEIDLLIADSVDQGVLDAGERERLHQALQISVRTASELMTPRTSMQALDMDAPIDESLRGAATSPYSRLAVYRHTLDSIIGIVHARDLVGYWLEHGPPRSLAEVLRPVPTVPATLRADRLLAVLRERRSQIAIVVDEYGGVAGLVTFEDILSEMFGDVGDEFKAPGPSPERLPDGRVRLPGMLRLREAEPWLGVPWDGEAETVGGRVVEALGRFPVAGERVTISGVDVEVDRVSERIVASVLVRPARPEEPS